MKKVIGSCLLVLLIALIFTSTAEAQDKHLKIGKIFAKEEANQLFGNPVISIPIRKDLLKAAIAKADKYVLLTIKGKLPLILDTRRISLLGDNFALNNGERAFVFSKEVVEEFLSSSKSPVIYFEIRGISSAEANQKVTSAAYGANTVFSVSDGIYTLEASLICPPICL